MAIDWNTLNQESSQYQTISTGLDIDGKVDTVMYAGLYARLSDINALYTADTPVNLGIFVDTLIIDEPTIKTYANVIVARSVDTTALNGAPLTIEVGNQGISSDNIKDINPQINPRHRLSVSPMKSAKSSQWTLNEFLINSTIGSPLRIHVAGTDVIGVVNTNAGVEAMKIYEFESDGQGSAEGSTSGSASDLRDLSKRIWALNSMRAGFMTGSSLMYSTDHDDRLVAQGIFNWIMQLTNTLGLDGHTMPGEYAELNTNSTSLLVMLNVEPGAIYVPVLSSSYYQQEIQNFLTALEDYEGDEQTLNMESDIESAIEEVSNALGDVADIETYPLQKQLDNIKENFANLSEEVQTLLGEYGSQSGHASDLYDTLEFALIDQKAKETIQAIFSLGMDAMKTGFSAGTAVESGGADLSAVSDTIENFTNAVESAKSLYDSIDQDTTPDVENLGGQMWNLLDSQKRIIKTLQAGGILWAQENGTSDVGTIPSDLGAISLDPTLAWDNFMISADNVLANLSISIGDGAGSDDSQVAANNYLTALKILAQYGKAIAAKIITYASLLSQASMVYARLKAAQEVMDRWQELKDNATSTEEELAALKGIVHARQMSIKRSIFNAWLHYRNAYLFIYFEEPPVEIDLTMRSGALRERLAEVTSWVGELLGDDPSGKTIQLPDTEVQVDLEFDILKQEEAAQFGENIALLTIPSGGAPYQLNWIIPFGTPLLDGQIPKPNDAVAVWVEEASIFLDGAVPNSHDRILGTIITSGSYENGLSATDKYTFVNKSMKGNYGYKVENGVETVVDNWVVNEDLYMMPTLYTQWQMKITDGDPTNATKLRMNLKISYRKND